MAENRNTINIKSDYNIVYRNKPTKPLTVSELFGKKEEPKKEPAKPVVEKPEVAEKEEKKVEVTPLEKNEEKKTSKNLQPSNREEPYEKTVFG